MTKRRLVLRKLKSWTNQVKKYRGNNCLYPIMDKYNDGK